MTRPRFEALPHDGHWAAVDHKTKKVYGFVTEQTVREVVEDFTNGNDSPDNYHDTWTDNYDEILEHNAK